MLPAPTPVNEPERIASLRKMLLLSTPDEEAFDRVTRTAQRLFKVPVALVSIVDAQRQWFKSCIGLPVRETGRDVSFCGHAILADEVFVIPDATQDERFADNPLVTGEPHVIFYAGRPLKNPEGFRVGTLCIIDHQPRQLTADERACLNDLGCWVEQAFLLRTLTDTQQNFLQTLDQLARGTMLDPMLNIWHRGAAIEMLKQEVDRAFRNKSLLTVLMIEVDHLKQITEQHGAVVGDAILIEFARRIKAITRTYDSLGRYGDDQFIVIMPDIGADDALRKTQRMMESITIAPAQGEGVVVDLSGCMGLASIKYVTRN